jgi:cohesin complex subunit SA-1/2
MEYRPTTEQTDLLINFIKTYVFSSRYDEVQDETRIEELHKKRSHLAAYCKLVVYNILPTTAACDIFKYYIKVILFLYPLEGWVGERFSFVRFMSSIL